MIWGPVSFSLRYGVLGIYRGRTKAEGWLIYPLPFVRIKVGAR